MRRLLGALLLLAGCAHGAGGSGAAVRTRPHAPLKLLPITGLGAEQTPVLEGAICQGLVDGNGGDVACPESTRQALEVARMRALATANTEGGDAMLEEIQKVAAQVEAAVTREGADYVLSLSYRAGPGTPPAATRTLKASSFDALVERSTAEARALLE